VRSLIEEGVGNLPTISYAIATIQWETANTFRPIEEYSGRENARRLGYSGGENYFGRGFIQLTHDTNYLALGRRIGNWLRGYVTQKSKFGSRS
jgi:hypothetical protein